MNNIGYTKGIRWNIEMIQNYLDEHNSGCTILSTEFVKVSENLLFKCKCGKHFKRDWNNMKRHNSFICLNCSRTIENKKKTHDIEYIKTEFRNYDFTILDENEYINNISKLSVVDSEGYKYYTTYASFKTNHSSQKFHKSNIYTLENISLYLKLNNIDLILLDDNYVSATT